MNAFTNDGPRSRNNAQPGRCMRGPPRFRAGPSPLHPGPLRPTLDFAHRLAALGTEVHVRFGLVPGLTDAPANAQGVAASAASLGKVSRVGVLPFHTLGEAKLQALGKPFTVHDTPSPTPGHAAAREIFAAHGLHAARGAIPPHAARGARPSGRYAHLAVRTPPRYDALTP